MEPLCLKPTYKRFSVCNRNICQIIFSFSLFVGITNSQSKISNKYQLKQNKYKINIDFKINRYRQSVSTFLICCLNSSKHFICLYRFGIVLYVKLPLKHSACVPYREIFVLGNFSGSLCPQLKGVTFKSKNFHVRILFS